MERRVRPIPPDHHEYRAHLHTQEEGEGSEVSAEGTSPVADVLHAASETWERLQSGDDVDSEEIASVVENVRTQNSGRYIDRLCYMALSDERYRRDLQEREIVPEGASLKKRLKHDLEKLSGPRVVSKYQLDRLYQARRLADQLSEPGEESDRLLMELAQTVEEITRARQEQVERVFPHIKQRFEKRFTHFINTGRYPISAEQLEDRLQDVNVEVFFPDPSNTNAGEVEEGTRTVRLSVFEVDEDSMERVLTHELMHVVSGQSVHQEDGEEGVYVVTGTGLLQTANRHLWLNEAVTERETIRLTYAQESHAYTAYRKLLRALQLDGKSHVKDEVFLRAYFAQSGEGEDEAAWQELETELDKAFAPNTLEAIQIVIDAYGPNAVTDNITRGDWLPHLYPRALAALETYRTLQALHERLKWQTFRANVAREKMMADRENEGLRKAHHALMDEFLTLMRERDRAQQAYENDLKRVRTV